MPSRRAATPPPAEDAQGEIAATRRRSPRSVNKGKDKKQANLDGLVKEKKSRKSSGSPKTKKSTESMDVDAAASCLGLTSSEYELMDGSLREVHKDKPLLFDRKLDYYGANYDMDFSADGSMMLVTSTMGDIRIYDTEQWEILTTLFDDDEKEIYDVYTARFTPDGTKVVCGGKRKSRARWSDDDEDNAILECPLKVFDVETGKVIDTLGGPTEEVLCVRLMKHGKQNIVLSCGQDGYVRKWPMSAQWAKKQSDGERFNDEASSMVFHLDPLPDCPEDCVIACSDDGLQVMDINTRDVLAKFPGLYSSYCDHAKVLFKAGDEGWLVVTRGCEVLNDQETGPTQPNKVILHSLSRTEDGKWELAEIHKFQHGSFDSNSWLMKLRANGNYLFAPTMNGHVYVFNIPTAELVGVLRGHEDREVRNILLHPTKPIVVTSADDGKVCVYRQD
eukprot:Clim_evm34s47 gene=Clim_evmTU34s47